METPSKRGTGGRWGHIGLIALALLAAGCRKGEKAGVATTTSATPGKTPAPKVTSNADDKPAPAVAEGAPPLTTPRFKFLPADGLRGPAAVIHDEAADVYLVSNVDGPPLAADGKGFISKLSPDGKKILPRWIEGGKNKVVLNAPKGMALRGDELFVADIDHVRMFHRTTGAPLGEVRITGSQFLAGAVLAPDGAILVSDAGLKASAHGDGLEPSGTDSVYAIYKNAKSTSISLVVNQSLAGPKGLFATRDKIWAVASRSGEVFSIDGPGRVDDFQKLPAADLEGLVVVGDELIVSSRAASAIFHGKPKGPWRIAIGDVKSPGNIGYDRKRSRLLVPLITEDEVRIYDPR